MKMQYAKKQPPGFLNHIKNVALVGAGGNIGSHILHSLLSAKNYNITVLTRLESTNAIPPNVTVKHIDYASHTSLVSALQNQDVLIITMAVSAPPSQEESLIRAAAAASVKWIIPNEWGQDFGNPHISENLLFLGPKLDKTRKLIEELGVSDWIVITSGFWYEYSLAGSEWRYGFDFKKRKVVFYGDGTRRVNTSTWPQIGRAVASLLSFKILPEDENDTSEAVLDKFRNQRCYISSFLVSQKDMWEAAMRVTGTKESDWNVRYEDVEERYKVGLERFEKGDMTGFGQLMYVRSFFPDGAGDYESTKGVQNEFLGLPKEDFDECTKAAVERAEKMAGTY